MLKSLIARLPYFRHHRDDLDEFGGDMKRMAGPVIIEQASAVLMSMISTMISAQLGDAAISAIGSVGTITLLVISVFSSLSTGGTVVVAQYIGQRREDKAKLTAANGIMGTFVIAVISIILILLFSRQLVQGLFGKAAPDVLALSYVYIKAICLYYLPYSITSMGLALLRGAGDVKSAMKVSLITNLISLVISYPLIYGFAAPDAGRGLGVTGSALAMAIAQTVGMVLVLYALMHSRGRLSFSFAELFRPNFQIIRNILYFGLPAGAEQVMFNGGKLLVQTFIMTMGTAAIAANTIVNSVSALTSVSGTALSILGTALVGKIIGEGNPAKARKWTWFIVGFAALVFFLMMFITYPLAGLFVFPFTRDPLTAKISTDLLKVYAVALPLIYAPSFVLPSCLRGAGDVRFTMIAAMLSMWLLRVGMSYVLAVVLQMGVYGIWYGMYLDWIGRSICFIPRAMGNRWLTHGAVK